MLVCPFVFAMEISLRLKAILIIEQADESSK